MTRTPVKLALALAMLTASFGLSACMDDHPDRGDHHGEHDHDHDGDHHDH